VPKISAQSGAPMNLLIIIVCVIYDQICFFLTFNLIDFNGQILTAGNICYYSMISLSILPDLYEIFRNNKPEEAPGMSNIDFPELKNIDDLSNCVCY
jgi:hypothetical protein